MQIALGRRSLLVLLVVLLALSHHSDWVVVVLQVNRYSSHNATTPVTVLVRVAAPSAVEIIKRSSVSRFHTNVASPDNRVSIQIVGYVALEVPSPAIAKNVVRLTPLVEISVFVVPRIRIRVLPEVAQPVALQVTSAATISAALPIRSFATRFAATLGKPAF